MKSLSMLILAMLACSAHAGFTVGNAEVMSDTAFTTHGYVTSSGLNCTYGAISMQALFFPSPGLTGDDQFAHVRVRWPITTSDPTYGRSGPPAAKVVFSLKGFGWVGGHMTSDDHSGVGNITAAVDNWGISWYDTASATAGGAGFYPMPGHGDQVVRDYADDYGTSTAFTFSGGVWTAYVYEDLACDAVTTINIIGGMISSAETNAKTEMTVRPKSVNGVPVP